LEKAEERAIQIRDLELALAQTKCGSQQSLTGELLGHLKKQEVAVISKG